MENTPGSLSLDAMFADYISEREGAQVHWSDAGFISFILCDGQCTIRDLYVRPEYRDKGYAKSLYSYVESVAREAGCRYISGMVDLAAKGSAEALQKFLSQKFFPVRAQANTVLLSKEL